MQYKLHRYTLLQRHVTFTRGCKYAQKRVALYAGAIKITYYRAQLQHKTQSCFALLSNVRTVPSTGE